LTQSFVYIAEWRWMQFDEGTFVQLRIENQSRLESQVTMRFPLLSSQDLDMNLAVTFWRGSQQQRGQSEYCPTPKRSVESAGSFYWYTRGTS
jgi:hypothetical protein